LTTGDLIEENLPVAAAPLTEISDTDTPRNDWGRADRAQDAIRLMEHQSRRAVLHWVLALQAGVLAVVAVATFVDGNAWPHMESLLGHIYTGLVGVTGTVLGYYFGRGDKV
jgi:hypothetical protein